jgi:hypothetical protein
MANLRTLLILGRTSNLPTVWSNCLAGWLLGGGGEITKLVWLCLGGTLMYLGGMFLNDAFDVEFDRLHRVERPIPSGAISLEAVWRWGFGLLGGGCILLIFLGTTTAALAVCLLTWILLYDAVHKMVAFSPVIMASCRFFLYLVAASTGAAGVTGWALWGAVVLAAYIVGLSYLARRESTEGAIQYWPCVFLAAPVILALIINDGDYKQRGLVLCLILGLWMVRCLRSTFWSPNRNVGRTVGGLLAGIVLVDWLAVADAPPELGMVFLLLFVGALLFQRLVPAT